MRGCTGAVLEARGLWKVYRATVALRDVNACVGEGLTIVVGPNGSGKSTLLSVAMGLAKPTRGTVRVLGVDSARGGARLRGMASYSPDPPSLPPFSRVIDLVGQAASMGTLDPDLFEEYSARLGLEEHLRKRVRELSSGFRKKVSLAMALSRGSKAVFLDEPFANLDWSSIRRVAEIIAEARRRGASVVIATHIVPPGLASPENIIALIAGTAVLSGDILEAADKIGSLMVEIERPQPGLVAKLASRGYWIEHRRDTLLVRGLGLEEAREIAGAEGGQVKPDIETIMRKVIEGEVPQPPATAAG
ncbi:MAG: ABC transporter ATP-binding protein [Desulfurococcales archaeon]|nr:ABC transporter ATP-binding protein [Desulfurococcales archaeon]